MQHRRGLLVAATIVTLCVCSQLPTDPASGASASSSRGSVTIYTSLPLVGDGGPQSEDIQRAYALALAEHGGHAAAYDVDLVQLNDADEDSGRWSADLAAANAWQAVDDPTTIAYLGEFNSGATAASLPVLNAAGIPQVSPTNTGAGLTRVNGGAPGEPDRYYPSAHRTYARVIPADHIQGGALVADMVDRGCTTALIVDDTEDYGTGLADVVQRGAAIAGIDIVDRTSFIPWDKKDAGRIVRRVRATGAGCLMFGGIAGNGAAMLANAVGRKLPGVEMFFPDGCAESFFTNDLDPRVVNRIHITNPTLPADAYPAAGQQFFESFRATYGDEPAEYAIYGYEAMDLLLDSIDAAGDAAGPTAPGRSAVVQSIFATRNRESVLGTYDIDAYGDTTLRTYGGYSVVDGELAFDHILQAVPVPPSAGPEITNPPPPPTRPVISPIEGNWAGGEVTEAMVAAEWGRRPARFVFRDFGAQQPLQTSLHLHGTQWKVFTSIDGQPPELVQFGTYSVDGDRIHFHDAGGPFYEYQYTLAGDTLTVTLISSDATPAAPGVPDAVFQYALLATPFHLVP